MLLSTITITPSTPNVLELLAGIDVDGASRYQRHHRQAIVKDLENSRVFIHFDDFLHVVFKVPRDWERIDEYATLVEAVLDDHVFKKAMEQYLAKCDEAGRTDKERLLCAPRLDLYNAAFDVLAKEDTLVGNGSPRCQWIDLKLPHVEEIQATGKAIYKDCHCPRIRKDGLEDGPDPQTEHAKVIAVKKPRKDYVPLKLFIEGRSDLDEQEGTRLYDDSESDDEYDEDGEPQWNGKCAEAQVLCGAYAMVATRLPFSRSHFIMSLVDRECFQLKVYASSGIVDSSSISLRTLDGQRRFAAMVVGLRRLSLEDRGFRGDLVNVSERFFQQWDLLEKQLAVNGRPPRPKHWKNVYVDAEMGNYCILDVLYRRDALVGELTCVVRAVDMDDSHKVVAIKCSRPSADCRPEWEFVEEARQLAKERSGEDHWVLRHLPNIMHCQDKESKKDSVEDRLNVFLNDSVYVDDDDTYYAEPRLFRTLVMEELYPIDTMGEPKGLAQVFFDILQCHNWLYVHPGILHCDISISNIMYRIGPTGGVHGVLNDLDVAAHRKDLEDPAMEFSGTPPFMAYDLLKNQYGKPVCHLYRHDLESLFTVMLMLVSRYRLSESLYQPALEHNDSNILPRKPKKLVHLQNKLAPFSRWFDTDVSLESLSYLKRFMFDEPLEDSVHDTLSAFKPWIRRLQCAFENGFEARRRYNSILDNIKIRRERARSGERLTEDLRPFFTGPMMSGGRTFDDMVREEEEELRDIPELPEPFDEETLAGHVTYGAFVRVMKCFDGEQLVEHDV